MKKEKAASEMMCYGDSGMSVMAMSHRSPVYDEIIKSAEALLREIMEIPDNYKVLFLQGGASTQFAAVPLNLMNKNNKADYILSGQFSTKAYKEAQKYGDVVAAASSKDDNFSKIPETTRESFRTDADYVHICYNNTIYGSKFVTMRIALTDKWTTESGEKRESTTWADVTMSNTESKVIPYLKSGVKIFVRGNGSLRLYSSPKERKMKAGIQCSATEIELCGGVAELVPRQLVDPDTGNPIDTQKYYWCNAETKGMKANDTKLLIDVRGNQYLMDKRGFVAPLPQQDDSQPEQTTETNTEDAGQ